MEKSLAKNAVFNVAYKMLNVIFPLISATYLARVLLPEGIGKISYAQNIVSYFTMLAGLGIPTYGIREISKRRDSSSETNKLFSELVIVNLVSTSLAIVIYIVMVIHWFTEDIHLYWACGLLILFNYINIDWFYQGKEEYVYIAVRSSLIKIVSLCFMLLFVRNREDYVISAFITTLAMGSNYIFNIIHLRKYVRFTLRGLEFKKHIRPILILVICSIATELYGKIDITMLGSLCDDSIVGYYSNAQKLVTLVLTFTTAIVAIFLPRISYLYVIDHKKYNEYVSLGVKIITLLAMPCCIGIILVADNLAIVMFGNAFAPAIITIRILAILILIKSLGDILCYQVVISSGNEQKLIVSYVIAAIINLVLNSILIRQYAQNGAAIASVISELFVNVMVLSYSLKLVKMTIGIRYTLSVVLSTACMAIVVGFIQLIITDRLISLLISVLLGGLVYFGINFFIKNEIIFMILDEFRFKMKR